MELVNSRWKFKSTLDERKAASLSAFRGKHCQS